MKLRVVFLFILFAALSRLLPHPPNFTPIAAMGLFGAAYLQRSWMAYVVPFVALFLSDLYLNNVVYADLFDGFTWFSSVGIYLSFALVIALSRMILHGNVTAGRVLGSSVLASVVFFLLTNFQSWLTFPFTQNVLRAAGKLHCRNSILWVYDVG
ncbi:MAG: hypothetical protein IPL65_04345 [Lewinellaceae bacterium]|nr:hypothetical protein [Lewinellaceae bacterium]